MTDNLIVGKLENLSIDFSDLKKTINDIEKESTRKDIKGLCFRCDYRARFLETGRRPRFECGNIEQCSHGCYMYKPVKPVILTVQEGYEDRPQFGSAMISARSRYGGEPDVGLTVKEVNGGTVLYWTPKD